MSDNPLGLSCEYSQSDQLWSQGRLHQCDNKVSVIFGLCRLLSSQRVLLAKREQNCSDPQIGESPPQHISVCLSRRKQSPESDRCLRRISPCAWMLSEHPASPARFPNSPRGTWAGIVTEITSKARIKEFPVVGLFETLTEFNGFRNITHDLRSN
jgi:hypothetical protein